MFPAWSILSGLRDKGSHLEKSYLILERFRRFEAKTFRTRVITFSELGGLQDLLQQKQVKQRRNLSRFPVCLEESKLAPARRWFKIWQLPEGIVGGALQPGRVKRQSSEVEGVVVGSLK